MKTFKLEAVYKRPDGTTKAKALFRIDADTEEKAKEKLAANLKEDPPHEITEVKE
jgi:hypothetical protein